MGHKRSKVNGRVQRPLNRDDQMGGPVTSPSFDLSYRQYQGVVHISYGQSPLCQRCMLVFELQTQSMIIRLSFDQQLQVTVIMGYPKY